MPEANIAGMKSFPLRPSQPQRICWGCDLYCAATDMRCGNGSVRTPHPAELFGDDWQDWGQDAGAAVDASADAVAEAPGTGTGLPGRR